MKRLFCAALAALICISLLQPVRAEQAAAQSAAITLKNDAGMSGLYLMFDLEYGECTIKNNKTGAAFTAGKLGILHEFIDLEADFGAAVTDITLEFTHGKVRMSEIYVFSSGQTPDFVQRWDAPLEGGADLLLLATHGAMTTSCFSQVCSPTTPRPWATVYRRHT